MNSLFFYDWCHQSIKQGGNGGFRISRIFRIFRIFLVFSRISGIFKDSRDFMGFSKDFRYFMRFRDFAWMWNPLFQGGNLGFLGLENPEKSFEIPKIPEIWQKSWKYKCNPKNPRNPKNLWKILEIPKI